MKHVRKLVLVDYDKYILNQPKEELNIEPKPIRRLDEEMYNTLNRSDLSEYEKNALFTEKLKKFLHFVEQSKNHQKQAVVEPHSLENNIVPAVKTENDNKSSLKINKKKLKTPKKEEEYSSASVFKNNSPSTSNTSKRVSEEDLEHAFSVQDLVSDQYESDKSLEKLSFEEYMKTQKERGKQKRKKQPVERSPPVLRNKKPYQTGGWISFSKINNVYKKLYSTP
jgi:hypothetical protein